jgi:hypothetical protein
MGFALVGGPRCLNTLQSALLWDTEMVPIAI